MNRNFFFGIIFVLGFLLTINSLPQVVLSKPSINLQDLKDVKVISNPKTPKPKDGLKIRIIFEEEISIGVLEGDENYMFGNKVYFNTDDEGNFYVNDWDRRRIHKYDSQGNHLCTFGKRGQGPGEFRNVWIPRFDKDNNLYLSDYVNRRISFFDRNGKFLKLIKVPIHLTHIYINTKGFYVGRHIFLIEEQRGEKFIEIYGLFDDKFNLSKEVHKDIWEPERSLGRGADSRAQSLADTLSDDAFEPEKTIFLTENDFIYFGCPEKYEIYIYSPGGKLVKIIKREYDPIKITKKHQKSYIKFQENEFLRLLPDPESIKKKAIQLIKYPKYKPAYETFSLMENGWLAVIVDSIEDEYTLFDIFDQEESYIAQFEAQIPTENLFFKNGKAYAVATENDYRYVKRYKYEIQEYRDNMWVKKK